MALVRLPDFAAQTGERLASRSVVDLGTFVSSRSEPLASVVHIFVLYPTPHGVLICHFHISCLWSSKRKDCSSFSIGPW